MSLWLRFIPCLCVSALLLPSQMLAQQSGSNTNPQAAPQPGQTSPPPKLRPQNPTPTHDNTAQSLAPGQKSPPKEPYIIEDGGFSIEPIYWLNHAEPKLYGGAAATFYDNFDFNGTANNAEGAEIGIPAGAQNTLRLSYFRENGNANSTLGSKYVQYYGETYAPGDYLEAGYMLQNAKISWDYLSYSWYKPSGAIRLKTLYEMQYVTVSGNWYAPFKPVGTNSSGNYDYNTAHGSNNLFWPSFGLELEQAFNRHLRWEAKASGFAIPHHATLWDAEGSLAFRIGSIEILAGEKAFHFKDSPQDVQYFVDTLQGAYVGLRYYWGGEGR